MHIKVNGSMTTTTVKPTALDKDGIPKAPAYLAITFKVDLDQLTEAELGKLLVSVALKDLHSIEIRRNQLELPEAENQSGTETQENGEPQAKDANYPSVEQVNRLVAQMREQEEYKDWELPDLSEKAREILQGDIPF